MVGLLLFASLTASAAEQVDRYVWDISFMGMPLGSRELEVTYERGPRGMERVLRATTTIDARPIEHDLQFQSKVAARAANEPAAFNASCNRNGTTWGTEVRWAQSGIYLTKTDDLGRAEEQVLPNGTATLSSVDLFDPLSQVALTRYESVAILAAETGEVWTSKVRRTGPTEVIVAGAKLLTEGLVLYAPWGREAYYYTADGVPVRYEYYVDGRLFEATLRELPPPGLDEMPVPIGRPKILVVDL